MKIETAKKRIFNKINKDYPLLRNALKGYFLELIILTYEGFQIDEGYDDMNDTEKLMYAYEINTCDWYYSIINEFDNVLSIKRQNDSLEYYNSCRS